MWEQTKSTYSLSSVLQGAKTSATSFVYQHQDFELRNLVEDGPQWSLSLLGKDGPYPKAFVLAGQDEAEAPRVLPTRPEIVLRGYGDMDRLGVRLGFVPSHLLGDEAFDQSVFVDDIGRSGVSGALLSKGAVRSAVKGVLEHFEEVRVWGEHHPLVLKQAFLNTNRPILTEEGLRQALDHMLTIARHLPLVEVKAPEKKVRSRSARWVGLCAWWLVVVLLGAWLAHHFFPSFGDAHLYEGATVGLWGLVALVPVSIWRVYGSGDAISDLVFSLICGVLALPLTGIAVGTALNVITATTVVVPVDVLESYSELSGDSEVSTTCYLTLDPGGGVPVTRFVVSPETFESTPTGTRPIPLSKGIMGWVYLP